MADNILTDEQIARVRELRAQHPSISGNKIADALGVGRTTMKYALRALKIAEQAPAAETLVQLPIERIFVGTLNPRKTFDDESVAELAEGIAANGLLQNLVVRPANEHGAHQLVAGERRLRALRRLVTEGRWTEPVPCRVIEVDDGAHLALALLENVARQDVPPLEEADAFARLQDLDREKWTTAEIAARIGKTQRYVQQRLAFSRKLGPEARRRVSEKEMTVEAARAICRLSLEEQKAFFVYEDSSEDDEREVKPITVSDVAEYMRWNTDVFWVKNALFDVQASGLEIDEVDGDKMFADTAAAFALQMQEIEKRRESFLETYAFVTVLPVGEPFNYSAYVACNDKKRGAGIIVRIKGDGEVFFHCNLAKLQPNLDLPDSALTATPEKPFELKPDRQLPPAERPGKTLYETFLEVQEARFKAALISHSEDYQAGDDPDPCCETCGHFVSVMDSGGTLGYGVCLSPKSHRAGLMTHEVQAGIKCHSSLNSEEAKADDVH